MIDDVPGDLISEATTFLLTHKNNLVGRENLNDCILNKPELNDLKEKVFLPKFNKYLTETCNKGLDSWNYRLNGWLVSYGEGNSLNYHNHRGSQLSSVLYIIADSEDNGGDIIFTDPRQNANRGYDPLFNDWFEPFRFKPKCAEIVIFPSFLYHFVETYGSNVRLAMPVDLFLFKK